MILCVTPNPAIDRTFHVNSLRVGGVHRASNVLAVAGGKGLNVARTIHALGGKPFCMGMIGGHTGDLLADLASREGLPAFWTRTPNETRTCIILVEDVRDATVINECGPEVDTDTALRFCDDVWSMSSTSDLVCISGSLPPGFSMDIFHSLLIGLVEKKKSVWVDTSGSALKTALKVRGINTKVNTEELGQVLGLEILNTEQARKASTQLLDQGAVSVVLTMGKKGAMLSSNTGIWFSKPPLLISPVSSVGSGDAFLGGLVFALDAGSPSQVALRYGVAAGAANVLHFGGGMVGREEFEEIYDRTVLIKIQQ